MTAESPMHPIGCATWQQEAYYVVDRVCDLVATLTKECDQARERTGPDALCPYPTSGQPKGQTVDDCVRLGLCGCLHLHPPHSNYTATLTAQRDKAVEALRPYKRLAEIVGKALVEDGPPARMKLKSGEIITGEPAEIFESLALTVLEVGKQAAAVVKEIDGK